MQADPCKGTLSLAAAVEALSSPYAAERFSTLTGEGVLVVDFSDRSAESAALERGQGERFCRALFELPCPTFALVGRARTPPLAKGFDVVVRDRGELEPIVSAAARNPLASLALVQLLRLGEKLDVHATLVAESLVYSTLQSGPEFGAWLDARRREQRAPPEPEAGAAVRVERWEDQLVLSLNRPRRHNAFSVEIRDALVEGLQMAVADESLREIVRRCVQMPELRERCVRCS